MNKIKWRAYSHIMRINKPIGTLLLLWPTLWALWLAGNGTPQLSILLSFLFGVFLMRTAGCVVNDYADRDIDGKVQRTAKRPMPSGQVSEKEAKCLFIFLIFLSLMLVLTLNKMSIALAPIGLALAWSYPFMKRVTNLPQLVLGAAFSWGIPMAYAAVSKSLPLICWLLFLANFCWTISYDTLYAIVDRDDDLKIGVKSIAILFSHNDKQVIAIFQILTLILLLCIGYLAQLSKAFYVALLLGGALFAYEHSQIVTSENKSFFKAFLHNNYFGLIIFIGIVINYLPIKSLS